jgi:hypothetical protein
LPLRPLQPSTGNLSQNTTQAVSVHLTKCLGRLPRFCLHLFPSRRCMTASPTMDIVLQPSIYKTTRTNSHMHTLHFLF